MTEKQKTVSQDQLRFNRAVAAVLLPASLALATVVAWSISPANVPDFVSEFLYENLGERHYISPPRSQTAMNMTPEAFCADTRPEWRRAQTIELVEIVEQRVCDPDNPYEVAAFVKGTNNISEETLEKTGLARDTVIKGRDLDGDGDPDEIHIRIEVTELNGRNPDLVDKLPQFHVAPGVSPGIWAFTPKARGMATKDFETTEAAPLLRLPAPSIRVEQGDVVKVTLENTHYLPHTIHMHGVDHPFQDANGEGNDGVPMISEISVVPGQSRTYEIKPRQTGTMLYHCHVHTHIHLLMGLIGMFIVEENQPNNWLQTFNVGAGLVRHPSVALRKNYDREYDLQYADMDIKMHDAIKVSNDPRVISRAIHREYDISSRKPQIFLLNGRSFPYTLRESLVVIKEDEKVKLRVANAGSEPLSLHTHGHKVKVTHRDGIELPKEGQTYHDVVLFGAAQRMDLELYGKNDGLHNYGPGVWLMHDHKEQGVTTFGIGPGGDISLIVYEDFLDEKGTPKIAGDLSMFFMKEYYEGKIPVFGNLLPGGLLAEAVQERSTIWILFLRGLLAVLLGVAAATAIFIVRGAVGLARE
ncbi:MAG: multicopper oxidase domain-containing protein [Alphaproteobacteria bacterium]|nr:multicopper oxidase domain-containing protein [Alphaproteobacteria bacterium]